MNCNVLYNFAPVMENVCSTILEGLNSEQKAAVSCVKGPVLIVAGAGSGKTRVLTSRIAYILEKGYDPARILALTFTKKAASEMKERIALMVGEKRARRLYMGTFHSVFIRFLREFAESLGYPSAFTIYDTSDSVSAIKTCLKELQLDDKIYKPKDVPMKVLTTLAEFYIANKQEQSEWVILPVTNISAYLGSSSLGRQYLSKIPPELMERKQSSFGASVYRMWL